VEHTKLIFDILNLKYIYYILLGVFICLTACQTTRQEQELGVEVAEIPFTLCMPTRMDFAPNYTPARRSLGDPGTTEQFQLPRYAYIFIMQKNGSDWNIMDVWEESLATEDWQKERYSGIYQTEGDSIYRYTKTLRMLLEEKGVKGRACAVASYKKLTFKKNGTTVTNLKDRNVIANWNDVLELQIDISPDSIQENLQNIYSSPYNYILPSTGEYYGTFDNIGHTVASLDLMLYHIAAKVDLKWSVAENKRIAANPEEAVRLTYLEVRRMLNTVCWAFKPMRNVVNTLPTAGYAIPNIVTPSDEGLWWEGRTYFYTIPFTVSGDATHFPMQLLMRTNGSNGTGYELTLNQPVTAADTVFVPWFRGNITLNNPLTDTQETKNAD